MVINNLHFQRKSDDINYELGCDHQLLDGQTKLRAEIKVLQLTSLCNIQEIKEKNTCIYENGT